MILSSTLIDLYGNIIIYFFEAKTCLEALMLWYKEHFAGLMVGYYSTNAGMQVNPIIMV